MHKGGELILGASRPSTSTRIPARYPRPTRGATGRTWTRHLFRHVDLANRATSSTGPSPSGSSPSKPRLFRRMIAAEGGSTQLLGVGRNGHIGFNEPTQMPVDEAAKLPTRSVVLHPVTLADAAGGFGDSASVPLRALTWASPRSWRRGRSSSSPSVPRKAEPLARALTGPTTASCPQPAPARGKPGDVDGRRGRGRGARVRGARRCSLSPPSATRSSTAPTTTPTASTPPSCSRRTATTSSPSSAAATGGQLGDVRLDRGAVDARRSRRPAPPGPRAPSRRAAAAAMPGRRQRPAPRPRRRHRPGVAAFVRKLTGLPRRPADPAPSRLGTVYDPTFGDDDVAAGASATRGWHLAQFPKRSTPP